MSRANIIWLASYPKSGNTWFRVFLTNVLNKSDQPARINQLYPTTIASSRSMFDEVTGLPSSELTAKEIEALRPAVYRHINQLATETVFHKVHDAYSYLPDGTPLFPPEVTRGVLYFVRNPLDVAVSFAHHNAIPIQSMVRQMNNPDYAFCQRDDRMHNQFTQKLLTWSRHVESWLDAPGLPLMLIRYEDMLTQPEETFAKALEFAGIRHTPEDVQQALRFSSFDELKKQEAETGFSEKSPKSESFFRKGRAGDWQGTLTAEEVNDIIAAHGATMKRLGYI